MAGEGQSERLVQYLRRAHTKERQIASVLPAHTAMAVRRGHRRRLEEHAKATERRVERLAALIRDLDGRVPGGRPGAGADASEQGGGRRAPGDPVERERRVASSLANARDELADAQDQIATYAVIRALARASGDKRAAKAAKRFGAEHAELAEYAQGLVPKLSRALVEAGREPEAAAADQAA